MADNDIYNSKEKYERFVQNIDQLATPLSEGDRRKYYCKNPVNLQYFKKLFSTFAMKDTSYVRRLRLLAAFKLIVHATESDLATLDRDGINNIVVYMHTIYSNSRSKSDFILDTKYLWKLLFPDEDERGRIDETLVPYSVRHLSSKMDKSRDKLRKDRFTLEEFEQITQFFSSDPRIQLFLTLMLESLGRPQEILYTKLSDVELHDNYAKIWISEHGKEGTGYLQCIDSYPYLIRWLEHHPMKKDKNNYLFINLGSNNYGKQLTPANINKKIRYACKKLNIHKPITTYSLKRNGVTMRRIRGDTDLEIQHTARWTSTKQLKTYDMSDQDDALRKSLERKGIIPQTDNSQNNLEQKRCSFCNTTNTWTDTFCNNCKRPLDHHKIKEQINNEATLNQFISIETIQDLLKSVNELKKRINQPCTVKN